MRYFACATTGLSSISRAPLTKASASRRGVGRSQPCGKTTLALHIIAETQKVATSLRSSMPSTAQHQRVSNRCLVRGSYPQGSLYARETLNRFADPLWRNNCKQINSGIRMAFL